MWVKESSHRTHISLAFLLSPPLKHTAPHFPSADFRCLAQVLEDAVWHLVYVSLCVCLCVRVSVSVSVSVYVYM